MKGGLVLVRQVRGIKPAGLRPSDTKSRKWRAGPRPSGTRNQVGGTSSVRFKVARKEGLSSTVRYEESSWLDFVSLVQSHAKGGLALFGLV